MRGPGITTMLEPVKKINAKEAICVALTCCCSFTTYTSPMAGLRQEGETSKNSTILRVGSPKRASMAVCKNGHSKSKAKLIL